MRTEGREHEGPSDKDTLGTVLRPRVRAACCSGVVSLSEPQLPCVHSRGWSGLSYLTSFRSQTPCDHVMKDTNSRKMHRHENLHALSGDSQAQQQSMSSRCSCWEALQGTV